VTEKNVKENREYQSIIITFNDGTNATFTGPAIATTGTRLRIVDIKFTSPKLLPPDTYFGLLKDKKEEEDGGN